MWEKTTETTGVEYYDKGVRLAFNHGIPDGQSTAAVADLRVVGMTQEADTLGGVNSMTDGRGEGTIDRRTGHVEIMWWSPKALDPNGIEQPFKQYILECKPSRRAKF